MESKMKIIGITGRARSGKDTLAGAILSLGERGERMSFAAPIREFVSAITCIPLADIVDGPLKEQPLPEFGGRSARQMMQTLGTEWGRELIHRDLWITVARKRLLSLSALPEADAPSVVVFSDVRFENEATMIRELGGTVVHLHRVDATPVHGHASEAGIDQHPEDLSVYNEGSIGDLLSAAAHIYAQA